MTGQPLLRCAGQAAEGAFETTDMILPQHPEPLLRLPDVLRVVPVSKSTWWAGVKSGRFPAPVKLGTRITCWRASDIARLSAAA
ncbi:helix-turn-helix transcriptional regulator [Azoarcus sp. KH32C]|uniref:helix-turn-helix transcriptional regulator n=1 Tax=Azoarcus sp. KH32C TaxID=748247 RepID=UPI00350EEB49